jgi:DNA-binding protein HU-beta
VVGVFILHCHSAAAPVKNENGCQSAVLGVVLIRVQVWAGLLTLLFLSDGGGTRMTKADLVGKVAGDSKITKAQAEKAVDGFVAAVSAALAKGEKVTLVGFGTFGVGTRSAREGRNPRTGDKITIPASKVVKFKPGKSLSEKVK